MAPKVQQSKEAKQRAAQAGGGRAKKKWGKGKVKDKAQHAVVVDQVLYDRVYKEVPQMKKITIAELVDRLKINGGLAKAAIDKLEKENLIKLVFKRAGVVRQTIGQEEISAHKRLYTRVTAAA